VEGNEKVVCCFPNSSLFVRCVISRFRCGVDTIRDLLGFSLNIFISQTVYTTHVRTNCKIVPLTNLNESLHNDISVTEVYLYVSVNNSSEQLYTEKKNTATSG
jgi:hypothetical protein